MTRITRTFGGIKSFLTLLFLALLTALIVIPGVLNIADASVDRTRKDDGRADKLPKMYDIRDNQTGDGIKDDVTSRLAEFRSKVGTNAAAVADIRDGFVRGEARLKQQVPSLKIEYNQDIRIPEVISPDMNQMEVNFLTGPNGGNRSDVLKDFLKNNSELIGLDTVNIDRLKIGADYKNPDGVLGFVRLEQEINDVPVFRGEVNAMFTKDGRMVRIINNLAPGIDETNSSNDFGDPAFALKAAAEHVGWTLEPSESTFNPRSSSANVIRFGKDEWAPSAEKMYFPTEPGVAVPAWRVLMWRGDAYYVIVDANSGTVLWHKNIVDEQTQQATFSVYNNTSSYLQIADSPSVLSPYISVPVNDPTVNAQGVLGTRTNVALIGNEDTLSFNNNGWITDGINITDGNNVEAGSDVVSPNGVDFAEPGDGACPAGPGCRTFSSGWIPQPNAGAQEPFTDAVARRGANIQMFYLTNRLHDELYKVVMDVGVGNFRHDNLGRGGVGGDRVSAEGQDQTIGSSCSSNPCLNNANFATPADGGRGRMQMYLWSGHSPRRDGTADADIMIHELSHGTSNRLVGNGGGLGNQGGMMGEGWGDWYAHTLLAQPGEDVNAIYALSGYATSSVNGFVGSYYYGIRRFPTAVITTTGGNPSAACNNQPCPHNPLTFKHINAGCDTTLGTTTAVTSAFRRNPVFGSLADCSGVHNAGEIWKSALWEVRARMVTRLNFQPGTLRVLQAVTTGMKNTPANPTFLQARDGIIAAAAAQSFGTPEATADVADVREGFRVRGMGFSASVTNSTTVTEAFDVPNVRQADPFSVAEAPSGNDGDGFPEPGENLTLSIAVTNPSTGAPITGVQVSVNGGTAVSYGTINDGQTVTNNVPYTVPGGAACGSLHQLSIVVSSSVGPQPAVVKEVRLGAPVVGAPVTFTNNTLMNIPNGQPTTTSGVAGPYSSDIAVSGLSGNKNIVVTLTQNGHSWPGDMDILLESPNGQKMVIMSDAFDSSNRAPNTVVTTMTIRDAAAATMPLTGQWPAISDFRPTNSGTTDTFAAPAPVGPYSHPAPGGTATFASTFGSDGTTMNGTWKLWVVDDAASDTGTMASWSITFEPNDYTCVNVTSGSVSGRVVNAAGRGIGGAVVTMTNGGNTRMARTSTFGYFIFVDVPFNVQYTITPKAKRYTFTPQLVTPSGNVTGLTFVGT